MDHKNGSWINGVKTIEDNQDHSCKFVVVFFSQKGYQLSFFWKSTPLS